jgi:hypothetical protein
MSKPTLTLIPPRPSVTLTLDPCDCGCKALMVSEHSDDCITDRGSVLIEEHAQAGVSAHVSRVVYLDPHGKEIDTALIITKLAEQAALEMVFSHLAKKGYTRA